MSGFDVEAARRVVMERLQKGYHAAGHHPNCATGTDEGCDCYAQASAPARQSLLAACDEIERLREVVQELRNGQEMVLAEVTRLRSLLAEATEALTQISASADDNWSREHARVTLTRLQEER